MKRHILIFLVFLILLPACAGKEIMEKPADELANDGMKNYKNKNIKPPSRILRN
jgi:hypothetical protein